MIKIFTLTAALTALLMAGCGSRSVVLDPEATFLPLRTDWRASALELARAGRYDDQLCITAQHMILNSDSGDFTVHLQRGEGNGFHTIQMGISPQARIVRIAMTTLTAGPVGYATYVGCKMVDRDRVNDQLDLRLRGEDVSCRNINELTYATALELLTPAERRAYVEGGKPLRFADDFITAGGGEWLPLPADQFIRDVPGEYLEIRAPAVRVPWSRAERVFYQGTHHCKLIALEAMQRWMINGALRDAPRLFPPTRVACTAPSATVSRVGSCVFYFAPAAARFCQDYTGADWTAEKAKAECAQRHANAGALRGAGNEYEGSGGVFSSITCADRKDIPPIAGTCVFNCAEPDESLWQVSAQAASGPSMTRACDLYIPAVD